MITVREQCINIGRADPHRLLPRTSNQGIMLRMTKRRTKVVSPRAAKRAEGRKALEVTKPDDAEVNAIFENTIMQEFLAVSAWCYSYMYLLLVTLRKLGCKRTFGFALRSREGSSRSSWWR